jgi:hypothetical protein
MKFLSRPYEAIAEIFKSGTQERLLAEIEAGMHIWQTVSLPFKPSYLLFS